MQDELTLSQAAPLLGLKNRKGVQALINRGDLRSEIRQAAFGKEYRVVSRSDVEALARKRAEALADDTPRRGRRPNVPSAIVPEKRAA